LLAVTVDKSPAIRYVLLHFRHSTIIHTVQAIGDGVDLLQSFPVEQGKSIDQDNNNNAGAMEPVMEMEVFFR